MNATRRYLARTAALLAAGVVAVAISYTYFSKQHDASTAASQDLFTCQNLAQEIQLLRQRPSLAGVEELELTELARVVEDAAGEAKIAPDALVRVWPESARRLGESPYQEKPTQVLFRGVTLPQLITFLCRVNDQTNLRITHLRLTAPRDDETGSSWTAETTLSYLIYAPRVTP